ncbi:MAG: hypothetical protein A2044_07850 [Candidatus Firestonebacteria bacterium GWA2_43_8]|nr:MAG: hypothetical protein A2044_07850 [Candidatus Firestonebacteria bacterium GWA2_43_8]
MVKTKVEAGICGFVTEIEAMSDDEQNVSFKIKSDCEKIQSLGGKIPKVDAYSEISTGFEGGLYKVIRAKLRGCCSGCAVPVGIFKSMQVAAMLALPKDIVIKIEKV